MAGLLTARDSPPVLWYNQTGASDCLLVCDHASNRIPEKLAGLGLAGDHLQEHIAWDIGAEAVTKRLAKRLDAQAILSGYSRLVVDCNRYPHHAAAFPATSDQVDIPGNQNLQYADKKVRAAALHQPYHAAIADELDSRLAAGRVPIVIAVHTMTEQMRGKSARPQEIGMCWALDDRLAPAVIDRLSDNTALKVGDNVPYGLDLGEDYTIPEQAMRRGLPHLQVEFRQDLVADEAGAIGWADRFFDAIAAPLSDPAIAEVAYYWPEARAKA